MVEKLSYGYFYETLGFLLITLTPILSDCFGPGCRRLLYTNNPYTNFSLGYRGGFGWVQELYQTELNAQPVLATWPCRHTGPRKALLVSRGWWGKHLSCCLQTTLLCLSLSESPLVISDLRLKILGWSTMLKLHEFPSFIPPLLPPAHESMS